MSLQLTIDPCRIDEATFQQCTDSGIDNREFTRPKTSLDHQTKLTASIAIYLSVTIESVLSCWLTIAAHHIAGKEHRHIKACHQISSGITQHGIDTKLSTSLSSEHHTARTIATSRGNLVELCLTTLLGLCGSTIVGIHVLVGLIQIVLHFLRKIGHSTSIRQFIAQADIGVGIDATPCGNGITLLTQLEVDESQRTAFVTCGFTYIDMPFGLLISLFVHHSEVERQFQTRRSLNLTTALNAAT